MAFSINDRTLDQTTKCVFSFQCLNDKTRDVCTVDRHIRGDGYFLKTVKSYYCPYNMSFRYSYICHCPIRCELYKHYKVYLCKNLNICNLSPCNV